ncbi:MAG: ribonuclease Y [Planctomycetota bacterium]|nr:ribonuclease Y [Planctomycetota bacterium]
MNSLTSILLLGTAAELGLATVGGAACGIILAFVAQIKFQQKRAAENRQQAENEARQIISEAKLTSQETALQYKADVEQQLSQSREVLRDQEHALSSRESNLKQQHESLRKQEKMVQNNQQRLSDKLKHADQRQQELDQLLDSQRQFLHESTGLDQEAATRRLLELLESELEQEIGARILKHEKKVESLCEEKSREMLIMTMQRLAAAHTSDSTTSTVDIPNDDMKGRIIGREGRNIRALEKATGVDVIIDDTPGVVIVSGFDPVRREVARQSLTKLITDGRIHPSRIEEIVKETQKAIEKFIVKKGEEAALEVNVTGLHERVVYMLGRLHFRTSYSQNVLQHSIEVSFLAGMLADMMGLNADLARRCGLLHDIGKAADHELEGGHPQIGADLLKRHGESPEVVHAAFGHHDEIISEQPYTVLTATGDACSASRPGARRESLDRYIKRMEELESIAHEFHGVEQAYAIQAGREVRVIVGAEKSDDQAAAKVCRDIAKRFEEQLTYPGEIKITVIRESRFTELAR